MSDVNMPKLSDTMEEGTVLEWKKQDGDQVSKGDVLAEIESDKASFEIEAESDGVLHIVVDKGSPVPVGEQIATIGGEAPQRQEKEARPDERRAGANDDSADIVHVQYGLLQWSVWLREHYRNGTGHYVPPRDAGDLQVRTP